MTGGEIVDQAEINQRFGFHRATIEGPEATQPRHVMLRRAFLAFASDLNYVLPYGREMLLAFEHLEDASMWAHKAIAREAPLDDSVDEQSEVITEETMHKVYKSLLEGGLDGDAASAVIQNMQNKGLLFREFNAKKP